MLTTSRFFFDPAGGKGVEGVVDVEDPLYVFVAVVPVMPGFEIVFFVQVGDFPFELEAFLHVNVVNVRSLEGKFSVAGDTLRGGAFCFHDGQGEGQQVFILAPEQGLVILKQL